MNRRVIKIVLLSFLLTYTIGCTSKDTKEKTSTDVEEFSSGVQRDESRKNMQSYHDNIVKILKKNNITYNVDMDLVYDNIGFVFEINGDDHIIMTSENDEGKEYFEIEISDHNTKKEYSKNTIQLFVSLTNSIGKKDITDKEVKTFIENAHLNDDDEYREDNDNGEYYYSLDENKESVSYTALTKNAKD